MTFKPMLASAVNNEQLLKLNYPVLVSPKVDGIRCLIRGGLVLTRSLKPVPNLHVRETLGKWLDHLEGFDGELVVAGSFSDVSSAIMSLAGAPNFTFKVFDISTDDTAHLPFQTRFASLIHRVNKLPWRAKEVVHVVPHMLARDISDVFNEEKDYLHLGWEGLMIRAVNGHYKHGRSTLREGLLLKLKRFVDSEATVVGFTALEHNDNEVVKNALGQTERSSKQSGKRKADTLGALIVRKGHGKPFHVGSGFTKTQRSQIWKNRSELLGRTVKFKYQTHGTKDAPRHPVFIGFRDKRDS